MYSEKQRLREEKAARREARKKGFEYRPVSPKDGEYARRLEQGFKMLSEAKGEDDEESY